MDHVPAGSWDGSRICFVGTTPGMVSVPVFPSSTLGIGLSIPDGAIMANHEKLPSETLGQSWSAGDGLGGAFRFYPLIFLQDGE